jgi:uncharacterized membrane protein YesL
VASRAEALPAPARASSPGLGGAIRAALTDGYYHSWRLVPANIVWAVTAIAIAVTALVHPLGIVLLPALAVPTAGIFRVTTRIVRGEAVSFWDAIDAWRSDLRTSLGLGIAFTIALVVLGANTVIGLSGATPLGWAHATLAAWGLLVGWLWAWTAWPILTDPTRADQPVRDRLRLAALLLLAHPVRIAGLGLALALVLARSAVAIVALVTVGVSFAALVASRLVLPAADRLEDRLATSARTIAAPDATTPGQLG